MRTQKFFVCLSIIFALLVQLMPAALAETVTEYGVTTSETRENGIKTVTSIVETPASNWFYLGAVEITDDLRSLTVYMDALANDGGHNIAAVTTQNAAMEKSGAITS